MNGKAQAVLWIGLILVGLNLVMHWTDIKSVIFAGSGSTTPSSSGSGSSGNGSGGFHLPTIPIIPPL